MFYNSTRNSGVKVSSAEAITQGISVEGGLFVPESIPQLTFDELKAIGDMKYADRAAYVFSKFLTDFTEAEIHYCTDNAYSEKNFETESIAEIAHLFDGTYMLELWHGPTCAFKDMALQILPYFLTTSAKKIKLDKKIVILVATSGDTGKAALEGFKDVEGTSILVFYPEDGVILIPSTAMIVDEDKSANMNTEACEAVANWLLSEAGQKLILEGYMHSVFAGMKEVPFDSVDTDGLIEKDMGVDWERCYQDREEIRTEFQERVTVE